MTLVIGIGTTACLDIAYVTREPCVCDRSQGYALAPF
jgi:hypothetical protein